MLLRVKGIWLSITLGWKDCPRMTRMGVLITPEINLREGSFRMRHVYVGLREKEPTKKSFMIIVKPNASFTLCIKFNFHRFETLGWKVIWSQKTWVPVLPMKLHPQSFNLELPHSVLNVEVFLKVRSMDHPQENQQIPGSHHQTA